MNLFDHLKTLYDLRLKRRHQSITHPFDIRETIMINRILRELEEDLASLSDTMNLCRAAIIIGDRKMYLKNLMQIQETFIEFQQQVLNELNALEKQFPWPDGDGKS